MMRSTALVLSAGGMFAAWEVGAWKALRAEVSPSLIVGASAGAWVGWAIAGGVPVEEIEQQWFDPETAAIMRLGLHSTGIMRPDGLYRVAQKMYERCQPVIPYALTLVEVPNLRMHLVRGVDVTWKHLAATCSIPFCFPPVEIEGRRYVDGGFRAALPLWAAEELGATRVLALNVLTGFPWSMMRTVFRPRAAGPQLETTLVEPETPLGSVRDGAVWSADRIRNWLMLGERDGNRALTSIRM